MKKKLIVRKILLSYTKNFINQLSMFSTKKIIKAHKYLIFVIAFATFSFLISLDKHYFFTDEILYLNSGKKYFEGDYNSAMQSPMIGKYIVGLTAKVNSTNVFWLRTPYAMLGVLSAVVVYLILTDEYSKRWGAFGSVLFTISPILYSSTRMVMLEAPLHFFILCFHYFFLRSIDNAKVKNFVFSGIFIGLAMGSKTPAIILYPFSILILFLSKLANKKSFKAKKITNIFVMYLASGVTFAFTYIHLFTVDGVEGLLNVVRAVKNVYINKSTQGKPHVVAGEVYTKSPWWSYFYYMYKQYYPAHLTLSTLAPFGAGLIDRSFFSLYWLLFLLFSFGFYQLSGVKNERYISTIELSLVILTVIFYEITNTKCK